MKRKKQKNKTPKKRAIELFSNESPFKPKVVKRKDHYTRKVKHKGKDNA